MNNWPSWRYESQRRRSRDRSPSGGSVRREERGRTGGTYWRSPPSRNQRHCRQRFHAHSPPENRTRAPYDSANVRVSELLRKIGHQQMSRVKASDNNGTSTRKSFGKGNLQTDAERLQKRNEVGTGIGSIRTTADEKRRKRPHSTAESTLFDMAAHLDDARKRTRCDFDPDLVMVVRQLDEGSRLLQMRPEFNGSETSPSVLHSDNISVDMQPLEFFRSDTNCAVRLGALISEAIDRHVDLKKLEQTAKSVSHQLWQGTAKNSEREIVRRQQPVLISTVRRSASGTMDKSQQKNAAAQRLSSIVQPASQTMADSNQRKLNSPSTVQPLRTFVNSGCWNALTTGDIATGQHFSVAYNNKSSDVCQVVSSSSDGLLRGSTDVQSVRRITVGKRANTRFGSHTENVPGDDGGKSTKKTCRYVSILC